jgi:hypothetical protein
MLLGAKDQVSHAYTTGKYYKLCAQNYSSYIYLTPSLIKTSLKMR